jgi:hypothetical protein
MHSSITVLVVHWVVRSGSGSCCGLKISFHLSESDYVLFARQCRRSKGNTRWYQEGNIEERIVSADLLAQLAGEEAQRQHGVVRHDLARV